MPIELIWRDQGVVFQCSGTITGSEIIRSNTECYADPQWPKAHFQLVDLEQVTHAGVSDEDLKEAGKLEEAGSSLNHDAKIVVVKPQSADESVSKLVTSWFMEVQGQVSFSIRFANTLEEANGLLRHAAPD